jgi:hypothetical protein
LANVAGHLKAGGHAAEIMDYSRVDVLDQLYPEGSRDVMSHLSDCLLDPGTNTALDTARTLWHTRRTERAFRAQRRSVELELLDDLTSDPHLDLIGFSIMTPGDASVVLPLLRQIRERRADVRTCAFGPFVDQFAEALMRVVPGLDFVCLGHPGDALVAWADAHRANKSWEQVPNLAFRNGGRVVRTTIRSLASATARPAPAYDTDTYPALDGANKPKLFTIQEPSAAGSDSASSQKVESLAMPRMMAADRVRDEMEGLAEAHGARAFHVDGAIADSDHAETLAGRMRARGANVAYTIRGSIHGDPEVMYRTLKASGCTAVSFQIDSGSQMLLENHYQHGFSVSDAEHHLSAAKRAGLFSVARFTHPCSKDDYHTKAETLRFIGRTKPDAVHLGLPDCDPERAWYGSAASYGYGLDAARYVDQLMNRGDGFAAPANRWRTLPFRVGTWSSGEVLRRHESMRAEVEELGLTSELCDHMSLFAKFSGHSGQEHDLSMLVHRQLLTGDIGGLSEWIACFNDRACVPAHADSQPQSASARAAVGD